MEVGKIADLVVLGGNPLDDIKQLANVVDVIKHGSPNKLIKDSWLGLLQGILSQKDREE